MPVNASMSQHVWHPDQEPGTKDHYLSLIEILTPWGTHEEPKVTWEQHMGTPCHEKSNREGLPRPRTALPCSWESSLRLMWVLYKECSNVGLQEVVFYLEQVLDLVLAKYVSQC